jgi:hypothetical protein
MRETRDTLIWMINLPAFIFWPFISAFPLFSLLNGTGSVAWATMQIGFLLTGFWALASGALMVSILKSEEARRRQSQSRKLLGKPLAIYATLWTLAYMAATLLLPS